MYVYVCTVYMCRVYMCRVCAVFDIPTENMPKYTSIGVSVSEFVLVCLSLCLFACVCSPQLINKRERVACVFV